MLKAISNTSPLLYLYRINEFELFPKIFNIVWTTNAVVLELEQGQKQGFDVPILSKFDWLKIKDPQSTPSEWLAFDLGPGELATMALALENSNFIVILDDKLARNTAKAAGLEVWGTLKILLEAQKKGLVRQIKPLLFALKKAGMWLSPEIIQRILSLASED